MHSAAAAALKVICLSLREIQQILKPWRKTCWLCLPDAVYYMLIRVTLLRQIQQRLRRVTRYTTSLMLYKYSRIHY